MKFIMMHKMTAELEKGLRPDPEIIKGVGELIGEASKRKAFHGGEGLKPSSERTHIAYRNGQRTVTDGPFTEAKELVGGFAVMIGYHGRGPKDRSSAQIFAAARTNVSSTTGWSSKTG